MNRRRLTSLVTHLALMVACFLALFPLLWMLSASFIRCTLQQRTGQAGVS